MRIDPNKADAAMLQLLPGGGPGIADHIIAAREAGVVFDNADDLQAVKFIGPKHDTNSIFKYVERGGSIFFQGNAATGQGHSDKVFAYIAGWLGMDSERPRNHGRLDDLNLTAPAYAGQ